MCLFWLKAALMNLSEFFFFFGGGEGLVDQGKVVSDKGDWSPAVCFFAHDCSLYVYLIKVKLFSLKGKYFLWNDGHSGKWLYSHLFRLYWIKSVEIPMLYGINPGFPDFAEHTIIWLINHRPVHRISRTPKGSRLDSGCFAQVSIFLFLSPVATKLRKGDIGLPFVSPSVRLSVRLQDTYDYYSVLEEWQIKTNSCILCNYQQRMVRFPI